VEEYPEHYEFVGGRELGGRGGDGWRAGRERGERARESLLDARVPAG